MISIGLIAQFIFIVTQFTIYSIFTHSVINQTYIPITINLAAYLNLEFINFLMLNYLFIPFSPPCLKSNKPNCSSLFKVFQLYHLS